MFDFDVQRLNPEIESPVIDRVPFVMLQHQLRILLKTVLGSTRLFRNVFGGDVLDQVHGGHVMAVTSPTLPSLSCSRACSLRSFINATQSKLAAVAVVDVFQECFT